MSLYGNLNGTLKNKYGVILKADSDIGKIMEVLCGIIEEKVDLLIETYQNKRSVESSSFFEVVGVNEEVKKSNQKVSTADLISSL